MLPFAELGFTGGYGETRAALRAAVEANDLVTAEREFTTLLNETIVEGIMEYSMTRDEVIAMLVDACQTDPKLLGYLVNK